jgi:hypothetical protein
MNDETPQAVPAEPLAADLIDQAPKEPVTESAPAPEVKDEPKEEKKTDGGFQKRIDELTRNFRETQRDRDYWRAEAVKQVPKEIPAVAQPKTLQDFGYDERQYQAYVISEAARQATEVAGKTLKEQQAQDAAARRRSEFVQRENGFAKDIEDYYEVTRNPTLPITPDMVEVINSSEDGAPVLYYLGKNPHVAETLAQLPPLIAARELGRLEGKLAQDREQAKAKTVSKAPPPPPKIEAANASVEKDPSSMTDTEFAKWRRKHQK